MSVVSPPGYLQAGSYAAADDRRNIISAMAQRSIKDTFNTGARGGWVVGKLPSWSVSGWAVTVSPATGVVENTFATNAGDYVALNTANQVLTHASSSGTLNRIDIAGCVVDDAFYSGSLNDGKLEIIQGTSVSGTPSAPALPNSFLPVYQASVPAGSSTPTITTMVKATSAAGGIPIITTAQLADIGGFVGEVRGVLTTGLPFPGVLYSYYGADGKWHGMQSVALPRPTQTGSGALGSGGTATIASYAIPDPGYPYHILASGMVDFGAAVASAAAPAALVCSINVDSTTLNTNNIAQGQGVSVTAGVGSDVNANVMLGNSALLTPAGYSGSHTLSFVAKNTSTGSMTIYSGPTPGNGGVTYQFGIQLVPA